MVTSGWGMIFRCFFDYRVVIGILPVKGRRIMGRSALPKAAEKVRLTSDDADGGVQAEPEPYYDASVRDYVRSEANRVSAEVIASTSRADWVVGRAPTPPTRVDSQSSRKRASFAGGGDVRGAAPVRVTRDGSAARGKGRKSMSKRSAAALDKLVGDGDAWRQSNALLEATGGDMTRPGVSEKAREYVKSVDRAFAAAERHNTRENVVSVPVRSSDVEGFVAAAEGGLRSGGRKVMAVDGYSVGSLDASEAARESDVVLEVKTASGVYLGDSRGAKSSKMVLGRGRHLQIVDVQRNVETVDRDGVARTVTVIQCEDVSGTYARAAK